MTTLHRKAIKSKKIESILLKYKQGALSGKSKPFNKQELYKEYLKHYQLLLSDKKYDSKYSKIKFLISEMYACNIKLNESNLTIDRKHREIQLDIIRSFLEKLIDIKLPYKDESYIYYPEITDSDFNQQIYSKQEFNKYKIPLTNSLDELQKKREKGFSLSNPQRFSKGYISEYTPYNGILLWHEVGVGKTCAGISIAENFKDFTYANDKKILILTPSDTLQQNWRDEIFNVEKELNRIEKRQSGSVQCTGVEYSSLFPNLTRDNLDTTKRQIKKHISMYYEFMGYQKLARSIQNDLKDVLVGRKSYKQRAIIQYIKKRFSNRVIIMDEVHFTRDSGGAKDKLAQPFIELIARYADNTKIILATATPMYNISKEIVWLINILLWNDNRSPLIESELFKKDGISLVEDLDEDGNSIPGKTTEAENKIIEKTKGYVSYVRGENPFTFPIKLYPSKGYTPKPTFKLEGGELVKLTKDERIKNMTFFKNMVSEWQYKHMQQYSSDPSKPDLDIEESTAFSSKLTQASNIVYPTLQLDSQGENIGEIGDTGFNECIHYDTTNHTYNLHEFASNYKDDKSFLHLDNIAQFSAKFKSIIESCQSNKGIGFVFSQFINSGIRILAIALEENGFSRYIGNDEISNLTGESQNRDLFCAKHLKHYSKLTISERKTFVKAKYILLDGQISKDMLNRLVKETRGEGSNPNINGEHIKIVLGSKVVEQGISLHRVREIHILDPWYHLNQMEQAAGRAIRNFSHIGLPDIKDRNVTLYLHIAALPAKYYKRYKTKQLDKLETSDERIYRIGYFKRLSMSKIERLLKKNAVDCGFNLYGNLYLREFYGKHKDPLGDQTIRDSKGVERTINLYDTPGSYHCDFQECRYKCYIDNNTEADFTEKINSHTFNEFFAEDDIQLAIEYIKELFKDEYVLTESDIVKRVHSIDPSIQKKYIYTALSNIIDHKEMLYDIYNRSGHLIDRNKLYIFQPLELEDTTAPMLYRFLPNYQRPKSVSIRKTLPPMKTKSRSKASSQRTVIKRPKKIKLLEKEKYLSKFSKFETIRLREIFYNLRENQYTHYLYFQIEPEILIKYAMLSIFEKEFTDIERKHILLTIVQELIDKKDKIESLSQVKQWIVEYYDRPEITKFILRTNDIVQNVKKENNKIEGFRFIARDTTYIYLKDSQSKLQEQDISKYKKLDLSDHIFPTNKQLVIGFMEDKQKKSGAVDTEFNIINKNDPTYNTKKALNIGGEKNKKLERTGALCGQAKGAKTIPDLLKIISNLIKIIQSKIDPFTKLEKLKKTKTVESILLNDTKKPAELRSKFTRDELVLLPAKKKKPILCFEIELLLRYCDLELPDISKDYRFFYNFEERVLQKIKV
tara:strand:+ start:34322 stop:38410 length:4089 start_codon:yes stop_codon:yes gene_type:complete